MNELPKKYILYADDDADDRRLLFDMVQFIDDELMVITVNDGLRLIQFLETLKSESNLPCFIILDIQMPVFNGIETLKLLKNHEKFQLVPVVMFSTSNNPMDMVLAKRFGASEFIIKPVHTQQMEEVTKKFAAYCHSVPQLIK